MKFKQINSTVNLDQINQRLISSWNSLEKSLRDQDEIVTLFNASQEAYGIALKLKGSSSIDKETITSIESLIDIKFDVTDVQCVVEGISIFHNETVQKFINWIKELFTKLKVWVRTLIEKLRTRFQWMSSTRMSAYLKKENITDDNLSKLTPGIIGKSIIDAVSKVATDSKTRKSMIRTVIESNTDKLDELKQSMWFASSSGVTALNGKMFDVEDGELVTYSNHEYKLFSNSSEESAPISMSDIIALEDAVKTLSDSLIEFEVEADTRSNALTKKLESLQDKNEMTATKDKLIAVKDAIVKNSNVVATICSKIDFVMKTIQQRVTESSSSTGKIPEKLKDCYAAFERYIDDYSRKMTAHSVYKNCERFVPGITVKSFCDAIPDMTKYQDVLLVRPAYAAQDNLSNYNVLDITRVQKLWISENKGDPEHHPASREVERLVKEKISSEVDALTDRCIKVLKQVEQRK